MIESLHLTKESLRWKTNSLKSELTIRTSKRNSEENIKRLKIITKKPYTITMKTCRSKLKKRAKSRQSTMMCITSFQPSRKSTREESKRESSVRRSKLLCRRNKLNKINSLIFLTKLLSGCKLIGEACLLEKKWKRHAKARRRKRRRRAEKLLYII
jgi:hypothetical protein